MRMTLLALSLFAFIIAKAQNPEAAQLQEKRVRLQREMDELKQSLDDTRKNRKAGLRELAIMQEKLRVREEQLKTISNQVKLIQGNINNSQYAIARLAGELDTLKEQYRKSIVYSYQYQNNLQFLSFVFSADNFNDGLKRIEYLKTYRHYRQEQAMAIRSTQLKLNKRIVTLQSNRKQKDEVLEEQEKEVKLFAKDKQEKNKLLSVLKTKENELAADLRAKEKAEKKLRDGVNAAIAREKEKERLATAPVKPTAKEAIVARPATKPAAKSTPSLPNADAKVLTAAFEKSKGNLNWPVEGRVAEHFGRYIVPGSNGIVGYNNGITLEMETGAAVKTVFDGVVIAIFDVDGRQAVLITHGKYYTTYSNLQNLSVSKGQKMESGQVIGQSAPNDYGKGQVIFMVSNESFINFDPEKWLKKR